MLGAYLAAAGRTPWNHGDRPGAKHDCTTFIADWCVAAGYPDPMEGWRDAYSTEAEATAFIDQRGLVALVEGGLAAAGVRRVRRDRVRPGDVAVIKRLTVDGRGVACAIRSGERWVSLIERGLLVDETGDVLRAWRVEWAKQ